MSHELLIAGDCRPLLDRHLWGQPNGKSILESKQKSSKAPKRSPTLPYCTDADLLSARTTANHTLRLEKSQALTRFSLPVSVSNPFGPLALSVNCILGGVGGRSCWLKAVSNMLVLAEQEGSVDLQYVKRWIDENWWTIKFVRKPRELQLLFGGSQITEDTDATSHWDYFSCFPFSIGRPGRADSVDMLELCYCGKRGEFAEFSTDQVLDREHFSIALKCIESCDSCALRNHNDWVRNGTFQTLGILERTRLTPLPGHGHYVRVIFIGGVGLLFHVKSQSRLDIFWSSQAAKLHRKRVQFGHLFFTGPA